MSAKRVMESFEPLQPQKVDKEKGIIYDALILGPKSLNGNEYSTELRQKTAKKFENMPVNLSHEKRFNQVTGKWEAVAAVDHARRFGKVKNIYNTDQGLRGNLHVMPQHSERDKVLACAEDSEFHSMFCLSPVFDLIPSDQNPNKIVDIDRVYSVDLVTFGGTTKTIYEEGEIPAEDMGLHEEEKTELEEIDQELKTLIEQVTTELVDFHHDHKDPEKASSRIGQHIKHHHKMHLKEDGKEEEPEEAKEEAKEEEYRLLKAEKHARRVCEDRQITITPELLDLLTQLPTDKARETHIITLKRQSLTETKVSSAQGTADSWSQIYGR